jgi:hypothetical protein
MFSASAVKSLALRGAPRISSTGSRAMASLAAYEDFGKNVFTGKVADEYLRKHGGSKELLNDPNWVNDDADTVANAVFDWYVLFADTYYFVMCENEKKLTLVSLVYLTGQSTEEPMSTAIGSNPWLLVVSVTD